MKESPTPEVYVVGAGAVGTALAMKLSRAGVPVAGLWARRPDLSGWDMPVIFNGQHWTTVRRGAPTP